MESIPAATPVTSTQGGSEVTTEEYGRALEEIAARNDDEADTAWEAASAEFYFWQPLSVDEEQRMYLLETSESWSDEDVAFAGEIAETMLQAATGYYDASVRISDEYFDEMSSLKPPEHLTALHDSFIATGREAIQFFQTQLDAVRGVDTEVKGGEELAEFLALVNLESGQPDLELLWEQTAQNDAACLALKEQLEAELEREVSICSNISESDSASAETNREALVALYNATGGPNWTNNADWLSNTPVGEWHGVQADSAGVVIALNLYSNGLRGEIPPELGQLSNLEVLSLYGNQLSGAIPAELGQLSNLEVLFLNDNQLSGAIPAELGQLSDLEVLELFSNNLSGEIPPELGRLANLTSLDLWNNALSGEVPPELGNLSKLETLKLAGNDLIRCVPEALRNIEAALDLLFC